MNTKNLEARKYIAEAREALQRGDKESAWRLGRQAALIAPEMEDAWLVLTASDPDPYDALSYARKALEINPDSIRARRALQWAQGLAKSSATPNLSTSRNDPVERKPEHVSSEAIPTHPLKKSTQTRLYLPFLIGTGCLMFFMVALFSWNNPAFASIVNKINAPVPTQENLWASVNIPKPTITPIDVSVFVAKPADTAISMPTNLPTSLPTDTPTSEAKKASAFTPEATETPGTMAMEIIDDNSISQSTLPVDVRVQYSAEANGEKWIDVNLSEQRVYVYESDKVVNTFQVSTGLPETPTVTGKYKIWTKVRIQDMSGPGYYLRDVPYVMYFYQDYGFHGTYWHSNFGTPMSRGCVNLTVDDAAWLYDWASVGTEVDVHY